MKVLFIILAGTALVGVVVFYILYQTGKALEAFDMLSEERDE